MGKIYKGIDVSAWQGVIDWAKVAAAGVDFAIIRCGYGTNKTANDDKYFEANYAGAKANGIKVGVYLYSYANDDDGAKSEAEHVLRLLKGKTIDLPVYYDLEENGCERSFMRNAEIFGDIVEAAGYWVGIYCGAYTWKTTLKNLTRFTRWVAKWGKNTTKDLNKYGDVSRPSGADIHQFSSVGRVNGINGNVDLDVMYRDLISDIASTKKTADIYVTIEGDTVATVAEKTGATVDSLMVKPGQKVSIASTKSFNWSNVKYFKRSEFACKCGKYCNGYPVEPDPELVALCDKVREHFGAAMIISSGVRCETHNANVGGVVNSRHKLGKAVDFRIKGKTAKEILRYVQALPEVRYAYAINDTYVHMDVK